MREIKGCSAHQRKEDFAGIKERRKIAASPLAPLRFRCLLDRAAVEPSCSTHGRIKGEPKEAKERDFPCGCRAGQRRAEGRVEGGRGFFSGPCARSGGGGVKSAAMGQRARFGSVSQKPWLGGGSWLGKPLSSGLGHGGSRHRGQRCRIPEGLAAFGLRICTKIINKNQ